MIYAMSSASGYFYTWYLLAYCTYIKWRMSATGNGLLTIYGKYDIIIMQKDIEGTGQVSRVEDYGKD